MVDIFNSWIKRYFSDQQAIYLALLLLLGFSVVIFAGGILLPVFAGVVIAYLLESIVKFLQRRGVKRLYAVILVFLLFSALMVLVLFGFIPLLVRQIAEFVQALPNMISFGQQVLLELPDVYSFIDEAQVRRLMAALGTQFGSLGRNVVSQSLASLSSVITIVVYLVLLPLLVFFFLKDKWKILSWFDDFLPKERGLMTQLWLQMDKQLGNYVRGKVWEILIVGGISTFVFAAFDLSYPVLLGVLVGLSVLVPYIGAVTVTVPVVLVAFFNWGWTGPFFYLVLAYLVIQMLDGSVLVPLMFSEVNNLHPIAIIVAVLAFGGLFGFWGVFFAIPLATLVQALLISWPRTAHNPP